MQNLLPLIMLFSCFKNEPTGVCGTGDNSCFGSMGSILPLLMFTGGFGGCSGKGC